MVPTCRMLPLSSSIISVLDTSGGAIALCRTSSLMFCGSCESSDSSLPSSSLAGSAPFRSSAQVCSLSLFAPRQAPGPSLSVRRGRRYVNRDVEL